MLNKAIIIVMIIIVVVIVVIVENWNYIWLLNRSLVQLLHNIPLLVRFCRVIKHLN